MQPQTHRAFLNASRTEDNEPRPKFRLETIEPECPSPANEQTEAVDFALPSNLFLHNVGDFDWVSQAVEHAELKSN